jgi:hypothetical protein
MVPTEVKKVTVSLPPSDDLYLRMYDGLKSEIASAVQDARNMERNVLLLCGAIWRFVAARCPVRNEVLYIPFILSVFGAARTVALMISIRPMAQYLSRLEEMVLADAELPGWEKFFRKHSQGGVGITMWLFWAGLIIITWYAKQHWAFSCR